MSDTSSLESFTSDVDALSPSIGTSPSGVGLSNERTSQHSRRMLDLVNKLHSLGVNMDIDLPQIVVIGAQSAGKSSTIESISGIKLPRSSGTCTRCPTECRLSRSKEPWKCIVSLRLIVDKNGRTISPVQNITFGEPILNPDDVEDHLRRAQKAVLCPSTPASQFLFPADIDSMSSELSFSPNFVSVAISGPNIADLSFCDLPGLVASATKHVTERDVELIEHLLVSYIKKPSCVILLTIACESDFETQRAYHLAMKHDPERKRTIGVLTKPDRIARGDESRWVRFIRNEEEVLELGWYCVKQPDSVQLQEGISWEQAREQESKFFSVTEPWVSLTPGDRRHLGTSNLVERLSDTLSSLIRKRLPELQTELQTLIQTTLDGLAQLPEPPSSDPISEMLQLVDQFTRGLIGHVEGRPEPGGLLQQIHPLHGSFRMAIRETVPDFRPYEQPKRGDNPIRLPPIDFLHDGEPFPRMSGGAISVSEADSDDDYATNDEKSRKCQPIYIDRVMERARSVRTRELPDNYPYAIRMWYIKEFIKQWEDPANVYFAEVCRIVQTFTKELVREHFGRFSDSGLHGHVQILVQDELRRLQEEASQHIAWLIEAEQGPFTLDTYYLSEYKKRFISYYKSCRPDKSVQQLQEKIDHYTQNPGLTLPTTTRGRDGGISDPISKIMSGLAELGLNDVQPSDLARFIPHDEYEPALEIMAEVRAYFQVSYKRFADMIPLSVDHDYVRGIGRNIHKALYTGLMKGGDQHDRCQRYLQESVVDSARREELVMRFKRLDEGKRQLIEMQLW